MLETEFADIFIQHRARTLCNVSMSNINIECNVKNIAAARCGFVVLLLQILLRQLVDWLNDYVRLNNVNCDPISLADMYCYLAVLFFT